MLFASPSIVSQDRRLMANGYGGFWYPDYPALLTIARAQSWGNQDLFPGFGMPSLV